MRASLQRRGLSVAHHAELASQHGDILLSCWAPVSWCEEYEYDPSQ